MEDGSGVGELRPRAIAGMAALLLLGSFALGPCPPARAEESDADLQARYESLEEAIERHKADEGALKEDLKRAVEMYGDAVRQDDLRAQLVTLVGHQAGRRESEVVTLAALRALGDMGDPRGARYVKPFLRQRDRKKASPMLMAAVGVAGEVPDASLVEPLLKIVEKSKTFKVATLAMASLGKFRRCKRKRARILERLVKTVEKARPGGRPGMRGAGSGSDDFTGTSGGTDPGFVGKEGGATARWSALTAALPGALNELTGRDIAQVEDWFLYYEDNKRNLKRLFKDEDE